MAESQPFELGKGLEKALCEPGETLGSLLKTVPFSSASASIPWRFKEANNSR
jgi:hypothetical protein